MDTASQRSGGVSTYNTAIFFVQAAGVHEQMGSGEAMRSGTGSSVKLKAKEGLQSAQKAKQGAAAGLAADAEEESMVTEGEGAYGGAFLDQQETNALQEKEGQRGGQGAGARAEAKSSEQATVGATALSSEAMEEAANQGAEEAVAEAQGSLAQAGGKAAAGQGSVLGEQLDLSAVQAQATQSQSLLKALATEEESQQEGALDQAVSESSSGEQGSMLTSVDTTLDEIRKLRIIDQELARAQASSGAKPGKDVINENLIEERTLSRLKKDTPARDKGVIEDLVHQQIEDQVTRMDDAQLMQSSLDILEYGAHLDTAQPTTAEPQAPDKAQKEEKELQMKKREAEAKKKAAELEQQELDRANEGHLKSQAALDDVQVAQTAGAANSRPAGEPLQPSAEASRISMDETFSYQKLKPKAPPPPVDQKKLLQTVVQESLKLSKAKAKEKIVEKEPAKPAPEMKKSNKTEKIAAPKAQAANSTATAEADKISKARDLFQAKQNQTKSAPSKPKAVAQNKPAEKPKKVAKKKGAKSAEERERESGQLDNLFLTLREDLIEGHKEERRRKRKAKQKATKGKHKKHRKGKHSHSFIEIEATAPKSATLLQLSQSESPDLSPDEEADLSLKRMAAKVASDREKGKVRDELAVDLSSADDSEGDSGNKGLAGADRSHDTALKTALREAEAEESLKKAERAANGEGGPETGNPEPYKTDSYTDKTSRRLLEEAESAEDLKKAEKGPSSHSSRSGGAPANDHKKDHAVKRLLEESDAEDSLKRAEKEGDSGEERAEDGALVQVHAAPPRSVSFVQVGAQVSAQAQAQAQVQAQIQATMQARVTATAQAKAATEALSALGVAQQSQIRTQDQGLIDALQRTLKQMQVKQNPAVAAAVAKKKAVNNIQKALTKKILTRLDDSQPLVNVFSKMQSLSKMMPAIQDFERRLNILHQVEPILENAIMTLNKVVDMSAALPATPPAPAPKPEPAPAAPATPDLGALKALLAQAQGQQAAPAAPEPAPEEEPQEDLAAALGGGGGGLAGLLAAAGAPAPEPEPAAAAAPAGLEALLGGAAPAAEQFAAPFLQAPAAAAAPENALAALLGGAAAPASTGLPATDESALISKLLGGALVQLDSDVAAPDEDQQSQQ